MNINLTKQRIYGGSPVLGTFLCMNSPAVSEVLSRTGFDYLIVDMEHGLMSIDTASDMINMMRGTGVTPLIRVEKNDEALINRALDAGAYGIMIPMINDAASAEKAVKSCKYPPDGVRGVGPGHVCLYGIELNKYQESANREILTVLQIEHIDAVNNIDEILSVPGIDVAFIGPSDLASSMNLIGKNDHPLVQEAIDKVLDSCNKHDILAGIYASTPELAITRIKSGFKFITYGLDSRFLSLSAENSLQEIKRNTLI